jgi:phospholipid transport system substrate-binding protein
MAAALAVAIAGQSGAEPSAPAAVTQRLNATLLDVMQRAKDLGYAGRRDALGPALDAAFDIPFMAEKVIGRSWAGLDEAARARWVALFREFLVGHAGR